MLKEDMKNLGFADLMPKEQKKDSQG